MKYETKVELLVYIYNSLILHFYAYLYRNMVKNRGIGRKAVQKHRKILERS